MANIERVGSEEAVNDYVAGKSEQAKEETAQDGPIDLFGNPINVKPRQGKLY
jgi:hypothetical protein